MHAVAMLVHRLCTLLALKLLDFIHITLLNTFQKSTRPLPAQTRRAVELCNVTKFGEVEIS